MYDYYNGDNEDPRIYENDFSTFEEADSLNVVECGSGCGYWRGDLLTQGCPECGDDCTELSHDHFED